VPAPFRYNAGVDVTANSRLGRLLRLPLRLLPAGMEVPVLSGPVRGLRWVVGAGDHGCWLGWYERDKAKLLAAAMFTGSVFYDVGANVGFYSLLGAACVGSGGRVFAFEPVPENLVILQKHIAMNQLANVVVIPAAVSDRGGACRFQDGAASTTGYLSTEGNREVETVALDALVFEGRLPVPQVIKIDIEGGEAAALRGAVETFRMHKPVLFLATHSPDLRRECVTMLRSLCYRIELIGNQADEMIARPA
jgi:FkbM family methyltransferase